MLVFGNDRYMHKITEMTSNIDTFTAVTSGNTYNDPTTFGGYTNIDGNDDVTDYYYYDEGEDFTVWDIAADADNDDSTFLVGDTAMTVLLEHDSTTD